MALSGLDIYKLLPGGIKPPHPKANCKECGFPTCLAFAMKLAAKQAELAACAYVSDEAKARLSAAAAPPIRLITLSADVESTALPRLRDGGTWLTSGYLPASSLPRGIRLAPESSEKPLAPVIS